ncbi:uncharacterized protein LOC111119305 [Crassostrea virginica]|uniref:Uncharacterized protein LOC111119305 n=1 Tax=Crassostrea virginica TaxID=6565 RepID=A0A8B8CGX8_CRAVI|nr:uncharacterized protein LOC111119305 [Crassostrea virginica]
MVLREETVIQVKSLVNEMEKSTDLNHVKEVVGSNKVPEMVRPRSRTSSRSSRSSGVDRINACMANNLFHSAVKGRFRKVKLILDGGYNINSRNNYGYSVLVGALHIDCDEKRGKMFRYLLSRNADPKHKDSKNKRSVLSWAAILGREEQVDSLLQILYGDHDLADKDTEGMTVLHHATHGGHARIVRRLVEEFRRFRLSVDVHDNLGLTPYLHAKRLGYKDITEILHKEGRACPGQSDSYTFRSAEEWTEIGQTIKEKQVHQKWKSNFERAAIQGSSRMLRCLYDTPLIRISAPAISETASENDKTTYFVVKKDPPLRLRPQHARENYTAPPFSKSEPSRATVTDTQSISSKTAPNQSLSLLSLTPGARLKDSQKFHKSQPDLSKVDLKPEKRGHNVTIGSFMKVLAEQNTSSYRPTIVESPQHLDVPRLRTKKDSTFASIFGKKRGNEKNCGKKKRGSAKTSMSTGSKKSIRA